MTKAKTRTMSKTLSNILAVVTALSLVFLQVPVARLSNQAVADASDAVEAQLVSEEAVDIPLTFEHAFMIYADQVIADPATKVSLPAGATLEFRAVADNGFEVSSVKATINETEVELAPDAAGVYKLTASDVAATSNVTISAVSVPDEGEEAAAAPAAEGEGDQAVAEGDQANQPEANADATASGASASADASSASASAADASGAAASKQAQQNERTVFTYEDDSVEVTATLSNAAAIPADAQFTVTPVTPQVEGYNYDAYMQALNDQAAEGMQYTSENTLLYDVAFLVQKKDEEGNPIEGALEEVQLDAGTVKIDFTFKNRQMSDGINAAASSDVEITHLSLKDSVRESVDTTADARDISVADIIVEEPIAQTADVNDESMSVHLDSLSVLAVASFDPLTVAETKALEEEKFPVSVVFRDGAGNAEASTLQGKNIVVVDVQHTEWGYTSTQHARFDIGADATQTFEVGKLLQEWGDGGTYAAGDVITDVKLVNVVNDQAMGNLLQGWTNNTVVGDGDLFQNYLVSIELADNGARIVLTRLNAQTLTAKASFQSQDGVMLSKLANPALEDAVTAVATLTLKSADDQSKPFAWAVNTQSAASLNAAGSGTFTFDTFNVCDYTGAATGKTVGFDPNVFNVSVVLYTSNGNAIDSYNAAKSAKRSIDGYDFISNTQSEPAKVDILLTEAFDRTYSVVIDDAQGIMAKDGSNYYVLVELDHRSSDPTYALKKVNAGQASQTIENITEWCDAQGNVVSSERFTGSEKQRTLRLVKSSNADLSMAEALSGANCTVLSETTPVYTQGGTAYYARYDNVGTTIDQDTKRRDVVDKASFGAKAMTPGTSLDLASVLGNARYFGVVANEWYQYEGETNAAVKKLHANQQVGNDKTGYESGEPERQPWFIAEVVSGELHVKGDAADVYAPTDQWANIKPTGGTQMAYHAASQDEVNAYVDSMLGYIGAMGAAMAAEQSSNGAKLAIEYDKHFEIDISESGPGTYYFNLDETVANSSRTLLDYVCQSTDFMTVKKRSDQMVVFTSTASGIINLKKYKIELTDRDEGAMDSDTISNGGKQEYSDAASSVIWNLPNATDVYTDPIAGVFLAPNAFMHVYNGVLGGWIVADTVENNGGKEIHYIWNNYTQDYDKIGTSLTALKMLDGAAPGDNRFVFKLWKDGEVVQTATNNAAGAVYFPLSFKTPGVYTYTITEEAGDDPNVSYDGKEVTATVIVTAQDNGDLSAAVEYSTEGAAPVFNNSTTTEEFTEISATKEWNDGGQSGADHPAVTFRLQQKVGDSAEATDAPGQEAKTIPANATGADLTVKWENLPLKDENGATITYSVVEDAVTGYTAEYQKVAGGYKVVNKTNRGSLKVRKSLAENGAATLSDEAKSAMAGTYSFGIYTDAACEQPYTVNGAPKTVSLTIDEGGAAVTSEEVSGLPAGDYWVKEITESPLSVAVANPVKVTVQAGKTGNASVIASFTNNYLTTSVTFEGAKSIDKRALNGEETYSFTMVDDKGATWEFESDAAGAINYPEIFYTLEDVGTHTYTVTESASGVQGVTAAVEPRVITVEVALVNGALVATPASGYNAMNFVNAYEAKGSIAFKGAKTLTDKELEAGAYSFQLFANGSEEPIETVTNNADGSFAFTAINYVLNAERDDTGSHVYTVKELVPAEKGGIQYSGKSYNITVTVSDAGDSTLNVEATGADPEALNFTNEYKAKGSITLKGTKSIDVAEGATAPALEEGVFTFQVLQGDDVIREASNAANGSIVFEPINYTQADIGKTYTYTVREAATDKAGYTIDERQYTVKVTVRDGGNGELAFDISGDDPEALNFTNAYDATGDIQFKGKKTIKGVNAPASFDAPQPADGQFQFVVTDEGGNVVANGKNNENGDIVFDKIEYSLADAGKTYTYTIAEVPKDKKDGVSTTADTRIVHVTVTDNGTGALSVTSTDSYEELSFTNTYTAEGSIKLEGSKALSGRTMADDEFVFSVADEAGNVVSTGTSKANGTIEFTTINYTLADLGDHTYKVKENPKNDSALTIDSNERTVVVRVADNKTGELSAQIVSDQSQELGFTNSFTSSDSVTFAASKLLNGQAPAAGAFTFELEGPKVGVNGIERKTNDGAGAVEFTEVTYNESDLGETYHYTIREIAPDPAEEGMTYDSREFGATVVVELVDGKVKATMTYDDGKAPVFENTSIAKFKLEGTKTIENRSFKEGDSIEFTLTADEGAPLPANTTVAISPAAGTTAAFSFDEIEFTSEHAGHTYTYTVTEKAIMEGVSAAEQSRQVVVQVTQEHGVIKVESANADGESLSFVNTYRAEGGITFAGTKAIDYRALKAGETYTFFVADETTGKTYAAHSNSDGVIEYPEITFAYPSADGSAVLGVHKLSVYESAEGVDGAIETDGHVYKMELTVSDLGNGTLQVQKTAGDDIDQLNFVNHYNAEGEITFAGTKHMVGRALNEDETYSFHMTEDGTENTWDFASGTGENLGKINFPTLTYTEENIGTHVYRVSESTESSDVTKVTRDDTVYTITVTVAVDPNNDGRLIVTADSDITALDFTNTYTAEGKLTFKGMKTITASSAPEGFTPRGPKANEFSFTVSKLNDDGSVTTQTATTDSAGHIGYPELSFTQNDIGKTYTYTVKEFATNSQAFVIDDREYTVVVKVGDAGNGKLSFDVSGGADPAQLDFANDYSAKGSLTFAGTKSIVAAEGQQAPDLTDGKFAFEVKDDATGNVLTATNKADGTIEYPTIDYTLADVGKTFSYTIRETSTSASGISVDTRTYNVKVSVADGQDGTLVLTTEGDNPNELNFVNKYDAEGSVTFAGTKTLTGRAMTAGEFTFSVVDENGKTVATGTNDASGAIAFSEIKYTLADVGDHAYTVIEDSTDAPGITPGGERLSVNVSVTDPNRNGKLVVTPSENYRALAFSNAYNSSADAQILAHKTLNGVATPADGAFTFRLTGPKLGEGGISGSVDVANVGGTVTFPNITFTERDVRDATYDYTISEVKGADSAITYDPDVRTAHVKVAIVQGRVTATVTYGDNGESAVPTFENTSKASIELSGTKTLSGRELKQGDVYDFVVLEGETTVSTGRSAAVTGGNTSAITFDPIEYTTDDIGVHTYTVKETTESIEGVLKTDARTYTVKVNVALDEHGQLTATALDDSANLQALDFTNEYTAKGSITFKGAKTLNGRPLTEGDAFTFTIAEEGSGKTWTGASDEHGVINYPTIEYTLEDVGVPHVYTITEDATNLPHVAPNADSVTSYQVEVEVTDTGTGALNATVVSGSPEALDFVNDYTAEGSVVLTGTKALTGRAMATGEFKFDVVDEENNVVVTGESAAAAVGDEAAIVFPAITYNQDQVGTHTYKVVEQNRADASLQMDLAPRTVVVEVTDNKTGVLDVRIVSDQSETLAYDNKYEAHGSFKLAAKKAMSGRSLQTGEVYQFEMVEGENTVATGESDSTGAIAFTAIEYNQDQVGLHEYTVRETSESAGAVTVDDRTYTVNVLVTDNGDGTLSTSLVSSNIPEVGFANSYEAAGSLKLAGKKTLTGRVYKEGETFGFQVKDLGTGEVWPATSGTDGVIQFQTINYTLSDVGEHAYEVSETTQSGKGLIADDTVYAFSTVVADNGDGTLDVKVTGDDPANLDFNNAYEAETSITFTGTKTMTGRSLVEGEFLFNVYEGSTLVATGTNAGARAGVAAPITFDAINYNQNQVGTHTYKVVEKEGSNPAVTYDTAERTVVVSVTDDKEGAMHAEIISDVSDALAFSNGYTTSTTAQLQAQKTVNGQAPGDKVYSFTLSGPKLGENGADGTVTAKSDETGTVSFAPITFASGDAGQTFTYTIAEVNENAGGVSYDASNTRTAWVTVSANEKGDLTTEVSYADNRVPLFANSYDAEGSYVPEGTKRIEATTAASGYTAPALTDGMFTFSVTDGNGSVVSTGESKANGAIVFTPIGYKLADAGKTFTYTVSEDVAGLPDGFAAQTDPYQIQVQVTDNGDGTLSATRVDSGEASLAFVNDYSAQGSITLAGTKGLAGRELTATDIFHFEIVDANDKVVSNGVSDSTGKIVFEPITYTLADLGDHAYTVREKDSQIAGVVKTDRTYNITVRVSDENKNGTLTVQRVDAGTPTLAFLNTYNASGSVTFEGTKSMAGRSMNDADVYTILIEEDGQEVARAQTKPDGTIEWPTISYGLNENDLREHTYTVTEARTTIAGVTVDSTTYVVKVAVSDTGSGTLNVVKSATASALNFTNTYNAAGSITLSGVKTIETPEGLQAPALTDGMFTFSVTDGNGSVVSTGESKANGAIVFTPINYTLADAGKTFTYTVSEDVAGLPDGYRVNTQPYTITVSVTDNGNGTLNVVRTDEGPASLDFVNGYGAVAEFAVIANKAYDGPRALRGNDFIFQLYEGDALIEQKANDATGNVAFKKLTYSSTANAQDDPQHAFGRHVYRLLEYRPAGVTADNPVRKGIAYDLTEYEFAVTVAEDGQGGATVAYENLGPEEGIAFANDENGPSVSASFQNSYSASGSVVLTAKKVLDGAEPGNARFHFVLADSDGNTIDDGATNANDGSVTFKEITYTHAGTYTYTISEVHPADSVQVESGDWVFGGRTYDGDITTVTVKVVDDKQGTLTPTVTYGDGTQTTAVFENETARPVDFELKAAKAIDGRSFLPRDRFSFELTGSEGAPMPASAVNGVVTKDVVPSSSTSAEVAFGTVEFTVDDVDQTYTYTVRELLPEGVDATDPVAEGVTYDPFAHHIVVTVKGNADGSIGYDVVYDDGKQTGGLTITNGYSAEGEAELHAVKVLQGRDLKDGEFFFTATGGKGIDIQPAHNDADGNVVFKVPGFTQADIGKTYTYTISEVAGTLGGIEYDSASYDVKVSVSDNGDGTLGFTYDYGDAAPAPVFTNKYTADPTSVQLTAHKALVGGTLEGGEFSFTLRGGPYDADTGQTTYVTDLTAKNDDKGKVTFDKIDYNAAGTFRYEVAEVVPAGSTDNGDGTFTGSDGIVYDGATHVATVVVTDNGLGKLSAVVSYEGGDEGISFGNTVFAHTGFEFDKYCFGGVGTFDFTMAPADKDGNLREGEAVDYSDAGAIVDDGSKAFRITVQNGAFKGGVAKVAFPELGFTADGDYHYLVWEEESPDPGFATDEARYLVHVRVAGGQVASTTYELIYDGENLGATDDLSFYNNKQVSLGFDSLSAQSYTEQAQRASVYPKARKYLNGSADLLVGGEFSFELVDAQTGEVVASAVNDETGEVAFFDEESSLGLAFGEPGTYAYCIREVAGNEAGVTYDDSVVLVVVDVVQTEDGLSATVTYNGPGGADPAFYNLKEGMDITVQKVSRFGGEGLVDCTYALWMAAPAGDVMIAEAVSDADGYITFENVTLLAGQRYYFKEVAAPAGHTVDPYRTAYFSLNAAGDELVLVEETAADGWHSATEK